MKKARKILNQAGLPLYLLVVLFAFIKDNVLVPIISKVWELTLMTTPYGFVSNANIGETLLRSPWIVLVGIVLLGVYLFVSLWQAAAIVVGLAYTCEDKKVLVRDILRISYHDMICSIKGKNWMMLIYIIIILPFTNIFQATEFIGAFVIPEYIQDFIFANVILYSVYLILMIVSIYLALRWFYLLPAFFLKGFDYQTASKESFAMTKKGAIKNGVKFAWYGFVESIRLMLVPLLIIILVCAGAFYLVREEPYASELFGAIVINAVPDVCGSICSVMIYLSSMCYVVSGYYQQCEANQTLQDIKLPELPHQVKRQASGRFVHIALSVLAAVGVALFYRVALFAVNADPTILDSVIKKPIIVAHKGYSSRAPENTMDAFALAAQSENVAFIELDVWSSKDGIPVVLHNGSIKAATGVDGNVYDYTYEELQKLPAPYAMSKEEFPNARIPSLEEVIATYADETPLLIEIKGYQQDQELSAKIVALLEKYNCVKTSMIHSQDYQALRAVKLCNSEIQCGLIQAIVTGDCYDLPYADFLSVEHSFVSNQMVNQLHKRNKKIYVWTVNQEESITSLKNVEVDGYITDYPDDIAEILAQSTSLFEEVVTAVHVNGNDASQAKKEFEEGDY